MSFDSWRIDTGRIPDPDGGPDDVPPTPVPPIQPARLELPWTFRAATMPGEDRPRIFDPALAQFTNAFRPGDPEFSDPKAALRWARLRRVASDHVLRRIAEGPLGDSMVLRGSRLLKAWIGDEAREPGDLDYVNLVSQGGRLTEAPEDALFRMIVEVVLSGPGPEGIEWVREGVATDAIWTYERVPGRRAVFPWRAPGQLGGAVQVDVVTGEPLAERPSRMSIPVADGGCVSSLVASPTQSLAWKVLWIMDDAHPQGKDLYDAVLLAERFPLPRDLLVQTVGSGGGIQVPGTAAELVENLHIEWEHFEKEYPWVAGDEQHWRNRLELAIGPTFGERTRPDLAPTLPAPLDPSWRTQAVVEVASGIAADLAFDRLPILSDALQEAGCDRTDILAHCLANGPHARGCWVVDLILEGR